MQKELSELLEYWKGLRDQYENSRNSPDKFKEYDTGISVLDKIL